MESLIGILGLGAFSFVSAVTPGPNNVLLWASGMRFGWRRTMPHVLGTALGIGALAVAVAFGLGAVVAQVPGLTTAMRLIGSAYLVWLAWQIARSTDVGRAELARPMSLPAATAFQVVNPKAWVFALGAMATFRSVGDAGPVGSLLVAGVMMIVVIPAAAIWAGAGGAIGRLVEDEHRRRLVNLVLAGLILLTVVTVWW